MHPDITFADAYRVWCDEMEPQWRRTHRAGVQQIFDAHLLAALGTRRVADIRREDILTLRAQIARKPGRQGARLSANRVNKVMVILGQMLQEATLRLRLDNPCKGIRRLKVLPADVQPLTLAEVHTICDAIRPDFRDYVFVRCLTGLRTAEADGLIWDCVDLEEGLIKVRGIYSAGMAETGAKTLASIRDIPMTSQVREVMARRAKQRDPSVPWVFCSSRGNPIDAHNFANRVWYPVLKRLGLKKRRPAQMRHTAATLLLASGENPEWVAKVLGHADSQMLFKKYSRYVPNLTRQDGSAFAKLLERHKPSGNTGED